MTMAVKSFLFVMLFAAATAQIPSLGWCPDYQAMPNFNLNRFLGTWYEAERYFTITELGSRCVTTTYEKLPTGGIIVHNEIRSALTGVKRVLDGNLQHVGRDGEAKLSVKYQSLPVPYDTHYTILDTDYDSFAVMWSCSGIGPVHTQNAWVMTRERLAPGIVLQRAYGILDKLKISRAFFVKTGQDDCSLQPNPIDVIDPSSTAAPVVKNADEVKDSENEEQEEAVVAERAVVPEEPAPKPKSPLPVAELIITNAEVKEPVAEKKEEIVPEVPAVPAVKAAVEPEKPQVPEEPAKEEQAKPVVNEIVNEELRKAVVENVEPPVVEQKNDQVVA